METINLNLIPTGARPVLHASQYDTGRQFRANLYEGSAVYTLTGAETLSIAVRKPDGHIVTEGITNTSDSYIIIETTEQMTARAGDSFAEVKIEEGGDLLGTLNLILAVEQSPEEGGDPSDSFVHNLAQQIADAVSDQYDSNNVIFDAAPTAGHGVGYAVTSEGIKTTIDNLTVGDLADVTITTPTSGEALVFDLTDPDNPVIVNGTVSTVGSLDDLNDVDTTGKGNDYSLVYNSNDAEWQAKKLTVEMEQADYEALGGDYSGYEGCHIVVKDGQNVTCNLGDLNDVDTTGASTGDILVKGATGWESGSIDTVLPIRHFDMSWGATQSISRNDEKDMLIVGGREGIGFQVLIPRGTAESVTFSNVNSCLTSISATTSSVSITIKNSGVGSKCFVTAIEI